MTKYKIYVSIDEKEYFWVIVENDIVKSKNPTKEELNGIPKPIYYNKMNICPICRQKNKITDDSILYPKNALTKYIDGNKVVVCKSCYYFKEKDGRGNPRRRDKPYNETNTCDKCREDGIDTKLVLGKAFREYDKNEHWTGRWVCYKHRIVDLHKKEKSKVPKIRYYNETNSCSRCGCDFKLCGHGIPYREYDDNECWTGKWLCHRCYMIDCNNLPESYQNIMKSLRDRRTGNLDPNSNCAKGDLFEELTERWRGVKNMNKELDCYNTPLDHSRDSEFGIIQTKGRLYDPIRKMWAKAWINEHDKEIDHIIFYCTDKKGENIERIYVFPKKEVIKRTGVAVVKDIRNGWYENYRLDESTIKKVNEIYHQIKK